MVLIDSSIWIDHFRNSNSTLVKLLDGKLVSTHPFIVGELALGQQKQQHVIIEALGHLPNLPVALDTEVMMLIQTERLAGSGIGYVDAHLIASAKLAQAKVWTKDKKLLGVLSRLDLVHV
jgi:predicted nucleic acid-binding protein